MTLILLLFLIFTYLTCSIPFGLLIAKIFSDKDIRKHGSKNIGATNVTRVLGKKLGFFTLILDGAKGVFMLLLAKNIFAHNSNLSEILALTVLFAVIGHIFSIYLKFKGGKGVATTIACIFVFNPVSGLVVCVSWLLVFLFYKVSAIASLSSVIILNLFSLFYEPNLTKITLYLALLILIFIRHIDNIEKLRDERGSKSKK